MTELNQIKQLLDKYWTGESSLEEEALLKSYFNSEQVDSSVAQYREFFTFLVDQKDLSTAIDWSFVQETSDLKKNDEPTQATVKKLVPLRRILSVAASLLVVVSFYFLFQISNGPKIDEDTYEDPEIALQQAKEALYFLTNKMDKGNHPASQIKQLEKLGIFN